MKIMIIGSMAFAKQMLEAKEYLEGKGHEVQIPVDIERHLEDPSFSDCLEDDLELCIKEKIMLKCFDQVANSDAVLVLNHEKNGIPGYIGASVLMELGIAYQGRKKIFILNDIPDYNEHRWAHEVRIIEPIILHGDISKI